MRATSAVLFPESISRIVATFISREYCCRGISIALSIQCNWPLIFVSHFGGALQGDPLPLHPIPKNKTRSFTQKSGHTSRPLALSTCEVCANAGALIMAAAPFSSWAAMLLKPRDATRMFWHYVSIPFAKLAHRTWIRPRFDTKYNALQRVAYFSIPVAGLLSVLTGWAIHKSMQLYWLAWIFGGYDKARI